MCSDDLVKIGSIEPDESRALNDGSNDLGPNDQLQIPLYGVVPHRSNLSPAPIDPIDENYTARTLPHGIAYGKAKH
jgi:hypothetical protein